MGADSFGVGFAHVPRELAVLVSLPCLLRVFLVSVNDAAIV
jgi:hypothetical protein